MMELFQAEWCPASRRVRELLTELGVSYVVRQVPVERADRDVLFAVGGSRVIPTLVLEDGCALVGEDAVCGWLVGHIAEPVGAGAHRAKAAMARGRELEEARVALRPAMSTPTMPLEVSR